MNYEQFRTSLHSRFQYYPKAKKFVGVILVVVGIFALVTPLTPGSWLALIGAELLGLRFVFLDKFKSWSNKE